MPPSSHCQSDREIHQQGLGQIVLKLVALFVGRQRSSRRVLRSTADLPASLRHDIGLDPDGATGSFEARWQEELKCLQR